MSTKNTGRKPKAAVSRAATKKPTRALARAAGAKASTKRLAKAKPPASATATADASLDPASASKQARLIALLQAKPGDTINQMMSLTGWQAHTVRGTISGVLRKRLGLNVSCDPGTAAGGRVYRIVGSASA